jgi:Tfp pilus assembly protein PilV
MRKLILAVTLTGFALALGAAPAHASSADEDAFIASLTAPALEASAASEAKPTAARNEETGPFTEGYCSATADCWNGTTVSCSTTSGSCSFVDAACNPYGGQRGWVKCGSQATKYCPSCPGGGGGGCGICSSDSYCNSCCPTGYGTCSGGSCTCMF